MKPPTKQQPLKTARDSLHWLQRLDPSPPEFPFVTFPGVSLHGQAAFRYAAVLTQLTIPNLDIHAK